jgi:hypothetical protein
MASEEASTAAARNVRRIAFLVVRLCVMPEKLDHFDHLEESLCDLLTL